MKRIYSIILSALIFVMSSVPAFAAELLITDFEGAETAATTGVGARLTVTASADASVELKKEFEGTDDENTFISLSAKHNKQAYITITPNALQSGKRVRISMRMRINDLARKYSRNRFLKLTGDGGSSKELFKMGELSHSKLIVDGQDCSDADGNGVFVNNRWYTFDVIIDTELGKYDVYVDYKKMGTGSLPDNFKCKSFEVRNLTNYTTADTAVDFQNDATAVIDIDDILLTNNEDLSVTAVSPELSESTEMDTLKNHSVDFDFNMPLNPDFATSDYFVVKNGDMDTVSCGVSISETGKKVTVDFSKLEEKTEYTLTIDGDVESVFGFPVANDIVYRFKTGEANCIRGEEPTLKIDGSPTTSIAVGEAKVSQTLRNYSDTDRAVMFVTVLRDCVRKPDIKVCTKELAPDEAFEFYTTHTVVDAGSHISVYIMDKLEPSVIYSDGYVFGEVNRENDESSYVEYSSKAGLLGGNEGDRVAVLILQKDKESLEASVLNNAELINENYYDIAIVGQTVTNTARCDLFFDIDLPAYEYKVNLYKTKDSKKEDSVYFVSKKELQSYIDAVNTATEDTTEDVRAFVDSYVEKSRFEFPLFDADNQDILDGIIKNRDALKETNGTGFISQKQLENSIKTNSVFVKLHNSPVSEAADLLNAYSEVLAISDYDKYAYMSGSQFSDEKKSAVLESVLKKQYTDTEEFKTELGTQIVLADINFAVADEDIEKAIFENPFILGDFHAEYLGKNTKKISQILFKGIKEGEAVSDADMLLRLVKEAIDEIVKDAEKKADVYFATDFEEAVSPKITGDDAALTIYQAEGTSVTVADNNGSSLGYLALKNTHKKQSYFSIVPTESASGSNMLVSLKMKINSLAKKYSRNRFLSAIPVKGSQQELFRMGAAADEGPDNYLYIGGQKYVDAAGNPFCFNDDEWYSFMVHMDTVGKTYTVYVNGKEMGSGTLSNTFDAVGSFEMRNVTNIRTADIYAAEAEQDFMNGTADFYIDDIKFTINERFAYEGVTPEIDGAVLNTRENKVISLRFNKPVNEACLTPTHFTLTDSQGEALAFSMSRSLDGTVVNINSEGLEGMKECSLTVKENLRSVVGDMLEIKKTFSFKTGESNYIVGNAPTLTVNGEKTDAISIGTADVERTLKNVSAVEKDVYFVSVLRDFVNKPDIRVDYKRLASGQSWDFKNTHTIADASSQISVYLLSDLQKPQILDEAYSFGQVYKNKENSTSKTFIFEANCDGDGERVAVLIPNRSKENAELQNPASINDNFYDIMVIRQGKNRVLKDEVFFDDRLTPYEYSVLICKTAYEQADTKKLYYISPRMLVNELSAVNSATESTVKQAVEAYVNKTQFSDKNFDIDNARIFAGLLGNIVKLKKANGIGFENVNMLEDALRLHGIFGKIRISPTSARIAEVMEENIELLGIQGYSEYGRFTDEGFGDNRRNLVYKAMAREDYADAEEFEKQFNDQVVLSEINTSSVYANIEKLLKNKPFLLGSYYQTFMKRNTQSIAEALSRKLDKGTQFTSSDMLIAEIKGISEPKPIDPGSGGGGGGGGLAPKGETITKVKVEAGFYNEAKDTANNSFSDLGSVSWAVESINGLLKKGVISKDEKFRPNDYITREEFTKLIVCALGLDISENGERFSDVDQNEWYAPYIAAAAENGITNGVGDGSFGIGRSVTREDAAVFLFRAFGDPEGSTNEADGAFDDENSIASYAKEAVATMKKCGILKGKGNNKFEPAGFATRAETAKMIYAMMSKTGR